MSSGTAFLFAGRSGTYGPNPSTSTDNAIVRWDGVGGRALQNSLITIDDTGVMDGATQINVDTLVVSTVVTIEDNEILLNSNVTGGPTLDADFAVERGASANAQINWNETSDYWECGIAGSLLPIVRGPVAAVTGSNFVAFDGTSSILVKDSGSKAADFATSGHNHSGSYLPVIGAAVTADNFVSFSGTTGGVVKDSGSKAGDFATSGHSHAHSATTSLQGGTAGEYYHLTSAQNTTVGSLPSVTFVNEPGSDHTGQGLFTTGTAGEALALGDAVYMKSDGEIYKAKGDASTTIPAIGIAYAAADAHATVTVLLHGLFRDDSYAFTAGQLLYVSAGTAGLVTSTAPAASGNQVQIVGVALTDDCIYVRPDFTYVEVT